MKMREISRGIDKKLYVNNLQNKGVVSEIRPDDEMPKNQYGEHAEIIFNALGVCNRLNPSQLYEVELNFFADNVQRLVKKEKTYKGKLRLILDFVNDINPEQCKQMKEYIKTLTKEGLKDFINETQEEGFYLCQPPFWDNINFDQLSALYDKWQFEPYTCTINGKPIQHKLIFGKEYILKLKHEASGKFSARSSAFINLKGSPSKSMSFKKNQDLYSSTPIRLKY